MIPSRLINGLAFTIGGILLILLAFYTIVGFIWGIILLGMGLYMLIVNDEDKIESIISNTSKTKSQGGKK